jgi:Flp pilus assembly protein TadG
MKIPLTIRLRSRRGNALVEFALSSLILIPIFVGTFQFGYTFYIYNLLCTQMRAGARYASTRTFRCSNSTSITNFKGKVKNMVRFGNPDGSGTLIEPGLTDAQLDVQIKDKAGVNADDTHVPAYVIVSTSTATPYTVDAVFTTFTFSGKPVVRFPYIGEFAPAETEP